MSEPCPCCGHDAGALPAHKIGRYILDSQHPSVPMRPRPDPATPPFGDALVDYGFTEREISGILDASRAFASDFEEAEVLVVNHDRDVKCTTLWGLPIQLDSSVPPGTWRVIGESGAVYDSPE